MTTVETEDKLFPWFSGVFVLIIIVGAYGLATGQFKSADRIECDKYANITVADLPHMPAKCQRYFK